MELTKTEYSMEEIMEITGLNRTKILRVAKQQNFKTKKIKEGRVWKHYYSAVDISKYLMPEDEYQEAVVMPRRTKSELVKVMEAENPITSLSDVDENVRKKALAKWALCRELTLALNKYMVMKNGARGEKLKDYSIGIVYSNFIETYPSKYPKLFEELGEISEPSLRRWLKKYDKKDPMKLIQWNQISKTKGERILTPDQRTVANELFLIPNQPRISDVFKRMEAVFGPKFISYETLRNYINKDIPQILKDKCRMGAKEFRDTYDSYVKRSYDADSIMANDLWVSDGHDLEFMMKNPKGGKPTSMKIVVWQDMATRMWVSYSLVVEETTEAILNALRKGIAKYGKPRALYTDNGKAYRSEKTEQTYENLGLEVINAIPYNAQAKPIERTFRSFKQSCAVWSLGYKGGHVLERPDNLKDVMKHQADNLMDVYQVTDMLDQWMEWYNNQKHRGQGMNGRTPVQRYEKECPIDIRDEVPKELLYELFLYRKERTVGQHGIALDNQEYQWENFQMLIGQKVLVKYDYENLRQVYIYTLTGKLISIASPITMANFKNSVPQIKEAKKANKAVKITLKKYREALKESKDLGNMDIFWEDKIEQRAIESKPMELVQDTNRMVIKDEVVKYKNGTDIFEIYTE